MFAPCDLDTLAPTQSELLAEIPGTNPLVLFASTCTERLKAVLVKEGNTMTENWLVVWLPFFYFPIYWE